MKRAIGYRRPARQAGPIQQMRRHPWLLLVAAMAILSITLVACGGDDEEAAPSSAPTESTTAAAQEATQPAEEPEMMDGMDLSELSGTIEVDGSSTVFPITEGDRRGVRPPQRRTGDRGRLRQRRRLPALLRR